MRRSAALIISLVLLGVFIIAGVLSIRHQKASIRKDLTRDHQTVGEMIRLAAQRMDKESLKSLVRTLDENRNRLSLEWIDPENSPLALQDEDLHVEIKKSTGFTQTITTWHRVRNERGVLGILQVREVSHQSARLMTGTIIRGSLQALLSIGGIILAFALGWSFAKRPDKKMAAKAKRALAGDFSGRIAPADKGTLADMAAAMDIMSEKIEEIESEFRSEVASKLVIMEQLRHADRLKTVGQLTSGVLHELGAPLTIVSGRAKMIEEGDVEAAEARESARVIAEQSSRISTLIRTILDFARRGKREVEDCDLNEVVSEAVRLLGPVALKQGVTLRWTPEPAAMPIHAQVGQLQQVLANLIINAVQASEGASEVLVSLRHEQVLKPGSDGEDHMGCVVIDVQDFGVGIPEEHLDSIFDSFYTTKKVGQGTGLGLSISKQIVIEHGGWIRVASTPGKGSTFSVFLPGKDETA